MSTSNIAVLIALMVAGTFPARAEAQENAQLARLTAALKKSVPPEPLKELSACREGKKTRLVWNRLQITQRNDGVVVACHVESIDILLMSIPAWPTYLISAQVLQAQGFQILKDDAKGKSVLVDATIDRQGADSAAVLKQIVVDEGLWILAFDQLHASEEAEKRRIETDQRLENIKRQLGKGS